MCLLMHPRGHSPEVAMRLVNDMATDCVRAFEEAASALAGCDELDRWITGVQRLVRDNVDWHFESERYSGDPNIEGEST